MGLHHIQRAVCCHKRFTDTRRREAPLYQTRDQVWLSTHDLHLRLPCRKLSPRYIGPFRHHIHPTFHVSLLKPFSPSATDTTGAEAEPHPPKVLDQPFTLSMRSWIHSAEGAAWNISSTGRGMDLKNGPGLPESTRSYPSTGIPSQQPGSPCPS
ncbi:hypothetical protein M9458_015623, partial [Cirrhinus mrigala]